MNIQEYKQLQIDRCAKRTQYFWDAIRNLEEAGEDPKAEIFDILAGHLKLELAQMDFWVFDDYRFFYSSDNDMIWN